MPSETVKIGDETHEIETGPITLICKSPTLDFGPPLEYPGRVRLDPEVTVYHGERVQKVHAEFPAFWKLFLDRAAGSEGIPTTPDEIRKCGKAAVHMLGLIDMSLKLSDTKMPFVWVAPETYLHPAWQVGLADLVIALQKRAETGISPPLPLPPDDGAWRKPIDEKPDTKP